ncbi:maleylpyruvate isomerase family mycothiol-dependent enzyme [Actinokineospora pegani]|uniref:maleylpyruvate isomerase family mycothiol-dependent enzyme n=1 Tax=Actinokineospora pegani TaxID=2654637 RepID=UPI001F19D039|nr:maleylpyruvate isomerase family mycothiol-dependent enzyme [Actinokineospora pegani]
MIEFAAEERVEFADFLAGLDPAHWDAPSLCAGWSVRDVVAHVTSFDGMRPLELVGRLARNGFSLSRTNQARMDEIAAEPPALVDRVRARPAGVMKALGGTVALVDGLIHHQDIRRALDMPREIPRDRLRTALKAGLKAPPIGAGPRAKGLRIVAEDLDWTRGEGPEVRGPGEALLMAFAGRPHALPDLAGPGVALLRGRMPRDTP